MKSMFSADTPTKGIRELPGVVPYGGTPPVEVPTPDIRFTGHAHFLQFLVERLTSPAKYPVPVPDALRTDFRRVLREVTAKKSLLAVLIELKSRTARQPEQERIQRAIDSLAAGRLAYLI